MKTKEAYREYLKTDHWMALRAVVLKRDGYKCTRCPSRTCLQAHHLFYRTLWTDSVPEDLITLCWHCHEIEHGIGFKKPYVNPPKSVELPAWITNRKALHHARGSGQITRKQFKVWLKFFPKLPKRANRNKHHYVPFDPHGPVMSLNDFRKKRRMGLVHSYQRR